MILFAICSSINGYNKGVYSEEERFKQTINTIDSIKRNVHNSYIVLCDNTSLNNEHENYLKNNVDLFLKINSNYDNKSLNEASQLINIINSVDNIDYDIFFKISGRYYLNEKFNIETYKNGEINFREFDYGRLCYSTVLYSFNKSQKNFMIDIYKKFIESNNYMDIESGLHSLLLNKVNKLDYLGVSGNIAPSGEYLEH